MNEKIPQLEKKKNARIIIPLHPDCNRIELLGTQDGTLLLCNILY